MLQIASLSSAPAHRLVPPHDEAAAADLLLGFAGPVAGLSALIVAGREPDLLCSLVRHGCLAATSLRSAEHVDACTYDLVVTSQAAATDSPESLIRLARRALVPSGRLIARMVDGGGPVRLAPRYTRLLKLNGFTDVRVKVLQGEILLRADLPAFVPGMWALKTARRA